VYSFWLLKGMICMLAAEWRGRVNTKEKKEEKQDGCLKATP
jgi:hypothetical protein